MRYQKVWNITAFFLAICMISATLPVCAVTVYRERYTGIGPYDGTEQELNVEGNELYYATMSGYKTIDEFSENEKTTLYAGDGRTHTVPNFLKETYLGVGWYEKPVVTLYTADGRQAVFYVDEADAQCAVGWYREKPVMLYTLDGRNQLFLAKDVDAQCTVGWYKSKPVTLYTLDGRSQVFPLEEADAQRTVGWYYAFEIEKKKQLQALARSFYVGQRVWMERASIFYPSGYITAIGDETVSVVWNRFYDYEWFRVYDQPKILLAEAVTGISLGTEYAYAADKIYPYK